MSNSTKYYVNDNGQFIKLSNEDKTTYNQNKYIQNNFKEYTLESVNVKVNDIEILDEQDKELIHELVINELLIQTKYNPNKTKPPNGMSAKKWKQHIRRISH